MGQTIQITDTAATDGVLLVSTDRSLTGQDGESFTGPLSAKAFGTFPARLAVRLFETDSSIDHVYVMSNALSIRRREDWTPEATDTARQTVANFFRFYTEQETTTTS